MAKNIAAWTPTKYPAGGQPPFVSMNRTGDYDTEVEIAVRGKQHDGTEAYVTAVMTREDFAYLILKAVQSL